MLLCMEARSAALIQADRDFGPWSVRMIALLVCGCALAFSASAQQSPLPVDVIDRPAMDTLDRIGISNGLNKSPARPSTPQPGDSCLLPPLAFLTDPTVPAARLQIPTKAKKEYGEACAALVEKNTAKAEKHLHKAVQEYPKYSAARVTLANSSPRNNGRKKLVPLAPRWQPRMPAMCPRIFAWPTSPHGYTTGTMC